MKWLTEKVIRGLELYRAEFLHQHATAGDDQRLLLRIAAQRRDGVRNGSAQAHCAQQDRVCQLRPGMHVLPEVRLKRTGHSAKPRHLTNNLRSRSFAMDVLCGRA